ncbi:hypothetical protein [Aquabacterium sp.]|uniref:hypothetical protein n=1 Tax=Aquabacterium sp. TaxID=1872578 RepID=UPI0025C09115|nr:hypothetical protein [Aquabacterium sp.]
MFNTQIVKAVAITGALFCAMSAHAVVRGVVKPVVAPPVIRPIANPPVSVPPGTVITTPVVTVVTCRSGQASRC